VLVQVTAATAREAAAVQETAIQVAQTKVQPLVVELAHLATAAMVLMETHVAQVTVELAQRMRIELVATNSLLAVVVVL
jgi:hypothetical protein